MGPIRQGDVILLPTAKVLGDELPHLTLVESISTGHSHRISQGVATLFSHNGERYLRVRSRYAILSHDEHRSLKVHHGNWKVCIQREYVPQRNGNTAVQPDFGTDDYGDYDYGDAAFFDQVFAEVQTSSQEQLLANALNYQAAATAATAESQPKTDATPRSSKSSSRNWQHIVD